MMDFKAAPPAGDDEGAMRKEGRSRAFQEILDLLTEMEMEPLRPKPPAAPAAAEGLGAALEGAGEPPGHEAAEGEAGLSPDEIDELQAKLEQLKG